LRRMPPLESGRDTEIDMIEREMEGGVLIIRPLDVHEYDVEQNLGGLIEIEKEIDVRELESTDSGSTDSAVSTTPIPARREPSSKG
jgi:hypothetical protein